MLTIILNFLSKNSVLIKRIDGAGIIELAQLAPPWVAFLPPISRKAVTNGSLGGEGALIFQKVDDRELGRYGIKAVSKKD